MNFVLISESFFDSFDLRPDKCMAKRDRKCYTNFVVKTVVIAGKGGLGQSRHTSLKMICTHFLHSCE